MSLNFGEALLWILWRPKELWYKLSGARIGDAEVLSARTRDVVKIEIGGGETPRMKPFKFLNLDVRKTGRVDIVGRAWELSKKIKVNNVGYIYSRHVLEHLAEYELEDTFEDWKKVAGSGCVIEIIVPNINFHIAQMLFLKEMGLLTRIVLLALTVGKDVKGKIIGTFTKIFSLKKDYLGFCKNISFLVKLILIVA